MIRLLIVTALLCLCFLLTTGNSAPSSSVDLVRSIDYPVPAATPEKSECKPCRRPDTDTPNAAPNVTDVALDKSEVVLVCPGSTEQEQARAMTVEVSTTAVDTENDVLVYVYSVSGGRVVGAGKKVLWDLTGTSAGTYAIVAGVDDGCGVCGQTVSKTVSVRECIPSGDRFPQK